MSVKVSTDENFEEIINSNKLVLIDFFGTWCSPCKALSPILEEISEEMKEEVTIYKHDIDKFSDTPARHAIRGVPTMLLFLKNELKGTLVGLTNKQNIKEFIKKSYKN